MCDTNHIPRATATARRINLQDDPELDHRVAHDVGGHDPICGAVLVELGQRVGPRIPAGDVEEGQEGPVEGGEVVRRHAAEEDHPYHRSCAPASRNYKSRCETDESGLKHVSSRTRGDNGRRSLHRTHRRRAG